MDWSNLPPELLEEIYTKLASVVEFIRFRAVCRSWRSVAIPSDLPSQLPWLLLPHDPSSDARPFLCLSTGATHVLRLPDTRNKRICGSAHGWLILFDESTSVVSLLNPLTGSLISLPPVKISAYYIVYATLSANPTSPGGCVVAIRVTCTPTMPFCWVWPGGSSGWSMLDMKTNGWVTDVAYHRGRLFVTNGTGTYSLYIWETTPKTHLVPADFTVEMPSPREDWTPVHCRLVDWSGGCFWLELTRIMVTLPLGIARWLIHWMKRLSSQCGLSLRPLVMVFGLMTMTHSLPFPLESMWRAESGCILLDLGWLTVL